MRILKSIGFCATMVYGLLNAAFIAALVFFLVVQVYVAASLYREGFVRIPDAVVQGALSEIHPDLWLKHEGIFLNFGGVITVKSLQVGIHRVESPLVEIRDLVMDVDLSMLLLARVELDRVILNEGSLKMPAIYSPTGIEEELLRVGRFEIMDREDFYEIRQALMQFGAVNAWGVGEFVMPRIEKAVDSGTSDEVEDLDLESRFRELYELREMTEWISDPIFKARLSVVGARENRVSAYGSGQLDASADHGAQVALGEVWSEIQFKQTEVKSLGVFGKFRDVAWEQVWQARTLELGQRFEGTITLNRLLNGVELVATEVRGPEMKTPVDLISLKASGEKLVTVSVEANAIWGDARVQADANLSLLGKRTSISASTRNLGITQLDTVESFRELGISSQIWGLDESRVDLETVLDFEGKWEQIQVHADTGPIAYKGLWLDNAWGEMTLFPDRAELHDFAFIGPFGSASGSLDFDWWSKDLALYISADAIPTSINPWMQEWWTRLWKPFSFDEENRPASDFYVNTTLGTKRSTDFFGRVAGAETAYNGVLFDSGSAKVWGKPRFTEAFDLRLSRDNEETAARLTWTFFPDRAGLMLAEYRLGGKVDLRTIDKIFPKTVQDITANFEPSGLVDLRVDGHNYGRTAKPEEKIRSEGGRVFASTESPIAAYGIQLDGMDMDASYGQAGLDISRIEFAAGGGTGNGQIQYFIEGSEASTPVLDVDVELDGLRRDRIFSVLPMLKTEDTPESPDDGGNARITLNLQAEGDPRDRFSFYGSGRARMTGGNLNDIGVFGGLSKTLSDTAFPVGSLSLNEIQSPVNIRGGLLEFKNIKGSGRGVRLRGDGVYQMEQDHMNFKINVSPGNMSVTPVYSLLTAILRPVASVFPIRVWGPINSPNWALDFFTSQAEVEAPALEPVFDLSPPINLGEISDEPLDDSKIGVGESISSGDLGDPMSTPQKSE